VLDAPDARTVAAHMVIVPVKTYMDALMWLQQNGGSL
jgi:hypothetical protein